MKYYFFISALMLVSCTNLYGETPSQQLSLNKAEIIAEKYIFRNKPEWGMPIAVRDAPGKYIFEFETPKKEIQKLGPRIFMVDKITGEVSFPLRM